VRTCSGGSFGLAELLHCEPSPQFVLVKVGLVLFVRIPIDIDFSVLHPPCWTVSLPQRVLKVSLDIPATIVQESLWVEFMGWRGLRNT
jgi:hypothetical protein